jgi:hypothetical protein
MTFLSVLLERPHGPEDVAEALADVLHLPVASVIELYDVAARAKANDPVLFELVELDPGDFVVMLHVFGPDGMNAESELASVLAKRLGERVLGSISEFEAPSLSRNPFAWVLATPDGALHVAYNEPDREPGMVLQARLEPWPPDKA